MEGAVNQGTLTAQNGGALHFESNNVTSDLGSVVIGTGGGHAYLNGTLDNTSATLGAPTGGSFELYGGTIKNGTIGAGALSYTNYGGTLDGVSITGDLNLPASSYVTFTDGTGFTGANANFANYAGLYLNESATLLGKALSLGTGAYLSVGANDALTLDSATTVTGDAEVYSDYSGSTITNQGTIAHTSGYGYLYAPTFTNQGAITVSNGTLYLGYYSDYTFANTAGSSITLTGGAASLLTPLTNLGLLDVGAGSTFYTGGNLTNGLTGTIRGAGTINGGLTVAGGTLKPRSTGGGAILTFNSGTFTVTNPATLSIEVGGAASDGLAFWYPTGTVNIGAGLLTLDLNLVGVPTASTYPLVSVTSGTYGFSGYFDGLPDSGDMLSASYLGTPYDFTIQYLSNGAALDFTPVPEPATLALFAAGLGLLAGWWWCGRRFRPFGRLRIG